MNGVLRHDQIWYDNGDNNGFLGTNNIGPDWGYARKDYTFTNRYPDYYDDALMHEAEANVQKEWDSKWNIATHNCHDYVKAVIKEYHRKKLSKCH